MIKNNGKNKKANVEIIKGHTNDKNNEREKRHAIDKK